MPAHKNDGDLAIRYRGRVAEALQTKSEPVYLSITKV